jgi:ABC-type nitrate/sulfonate/bicarbonate transport system substrate-binding protein
MVSLVALKRFSLALTSLLAIALAALCAAGSEAASSPTRVTIHVPSKSLAIMPCSFGKDKGFFSPEAIELQLVTMAPATAIAALVAGDLDFSSTLGAQHPRSCAGFRSNEFSMSSKIRVTFSSPSPRSRRFKI